MTDIKKAWETMKKELAKETGIAYGFVMNRRQIENRTATLAIPTDEYDKVIESWLRSDERVQSYTTWTDEQKAETHRRTMETVARMEAKKAKYGTVANERKAILETILASEAFRKFQTVVGKTVANIERKSDGFYQIRFFY